MTNEQKTAVTTLLQLISKLSNYQIGFALDEMDLNSEAFNEDMKILKDAVEWDS
jgi:hypothetical protein